MAAARPSRDSACWRSGIPPCRPRILSIPAGRGRLILVGIVNVVLGVWVVMLNPAQAFAFLGFLVGISLIFRGLWSLVFTSDLQRAKNFVETRPA